MNPLTLAELKLRYADLSHRAEAARQRGRTVSAIGQLALSLSRQARQYQSRADDYAMLFRIVEARTDPAAQSVDTGKESTQ